MALDPSRRPDNTVTAKTTKWKKRGRARNPQARLPTGGTKCPATASRGRSAAVNYCKRASSSSAVQLASPFVWRARAADSVKIGVDNTLTGTYAALGKNEQVGIQLAVEQINAKGGILGRNVELIVEDSTSGDAGTAVQKARKLIDGDKVDFLLGNVNSALALAMAQVSNEKKILHIVPGGHTDAVTGSSCHWNVFRVCNTTQMEASAVASALVKDLRQEILLHHARLRLRAHVGSRPDQGLCSARRRARRRRPDAARHDGFFVVSHQGAGGEPRRHPVPAGRATTW